ncbi:hypothetical protein ACEWBC_01485 [Vibrio parahaemolyticus]|uniref:hypothetical protein n=1 Tax=Vibrio parahaemolyticus TaxID=670 RepID=UPI001869C00B|nr:hypothetical protein [Vibrio parahaemolyticus]MBE3928778.1 hypothetical protein [Vibrio parahaemolyticus]MBE4042166.1 hypothetical protein [Vibrio parahaemolyticus]HCH1964017.1 hypothetical protein [Vibrio parahaemolyticus]
MKKRNLALLILLFGSTTSIASVMDPDCDAGKDKLPDEGMAGKAVDAMTPEKEKKTVKDVTKKLNKD